MRGTPDAWAKLPPLPDSWARSLTIWTQLRTARRAA